MIVLGCPIFKREFILPLWFKAIENQNYSLSDIGFVFMTSPNDPGTLELLLDFSAKHPEFQCFDIEEVAENHRYNEEGIRTWTPQRYYTMINLRNRLLERVKCYNPDKFFSLDSDVLLENPDTLSVLDKLTDVFDAVSPLMYMTPDSQNFPSVMSWRPEDPTRAYRAEYPIGTFFQADIIMAAVMMSKPVYQQVKYYWHKQGEDLGWSADATAKGFKLYSASNIYCPHIMNPIQLEEYLRGGDQRHA